jgi:hypothetical protein
MSRPARFGILHLAQGGDPDGGREFAHAALEGLELHQGAEFLQPLLVGRVRDRAVHRVAVRRGEARAGRASGSARAASGVPRRGGRSPGGCSRDPPRARGCRAAPAWRGAESRPRRGGNWSRRRRGRRPGRSAQRVISSGVLARSRRSRFVRASWQGWRARVKVGAIRFGFRAAAGGSGRRRAATSGHSTRAAKSPKRSPAHAVRFSSG